MLVESIFEHLEFPERHFPSMSVDIQQWLSGLSRLVMLDFHTFSTILIAFIMNSFIQLESEELIA